MNKQEGEIFFGCILCGKIACGFAAEGLVFAFLSLVTEDSRLLNER